MFLNITYRMNCESYSACSAQTIGHFQKNMSQKRKIEENEREMKKGT